MRTMTIGFALLLAVLAPRWAFAESEPDSYHFNGGEKIQLRFVPVTLGEVPEQNVSDEGNVGLPSGTTVNIKGKTHVQARQIIGEQMIKDTNRARSSSPHHCAGISTAKNSHRGGSSHAEVGGADAGRPAQPAGRAAGSRRHQRSGRPHAGQRCPHGSRRQARRPNDRHHKAGAAGQRPIWDCDFSRRHHCRSRAATILYSAANSTKQASSPWAICAWNPAKNRCCRA